MGDFSSKHNRTVWFDISVGDLDRASTFYGAVLAIPIHREKFEEFEFCILDHKEGNGGCLVPSDKPAPENSGILMYLNVDGRIIDAEAKISLNGGEVLEALHPIGPHGFRVLFRDSEGNRPALHSTTKT